MGMSGIAIGSFVQGASDGYDRARKRGIEDERMKWEREDQNDKQRMRDAQAEFAAQMQSAREQFATGKLPGQEENLIAQQAAPAPADAAQPVRQGIAAPDASGQVQAAPQGAAPAPTDPADSPVNNIFKSNGEGLYKNQKQANDAYWGRLRDITAKYYEKTNQVDKLMDIDKKIGEWKNSSYDELRKATAAAIATGDPGALKMASHLADLTGLGAKLSPEGATYDAKTQTWKNVRTIGVDGKEHIEDLSAQSLLTTIGQIAPEKLIEWNVNRQDKNRQFGIEERKAKADETRAANSGIQAKETSRLREIAQENQADYRRGESERKREAQFTAELESDLFRGKDPAMLDDAQREMITRTGSLARNLYAIPGNEKANAATLAGVARGLGTGKARVTELPSTFSEEQRANFLQADYAGARVLIPRSLIQQKQ